LYQAKISLLPRHRKCLDVSRKQEMKKNKTVLIQTLFVSLTFILIGVLCYEIIFSFFEPDIQGITFKIISANRIFKTSLLFSIICGLIPLITVFIWILLSLSTVKKIISFLLIVACISFSIFLRHQAVKTYFNSIVKKLLQSNKTQHFLYSIDPRHFVYNIIIGFCFGCLISCLLVLGKKKSKK
jgi:hypothetical protein